MEIITCHQAVDYISKEEENLLSDQQQAQLQEHLRTCSLCRNFQQQMPLISKAYTKPPESQLSEADREALAAALKSA